MWSDRVRTQQVLGLCLPHPIISYVRQQLSNKQHAMLAHFTLKLTHAEATEVIMTAAQRRAADTVMAFISDECLNERREHQIKVSVDDATTIHLNFNYTEYATSILPDTDEATWTFLHTDNTYKQTILAQLDTLRDAALPWAQASHALDVLNEMATEPEQIVFYAPWVRGIISGGLVSYDPAGKEVLASPVYGDAKTNKLFIRRLHKAKPPTQYLSLTREQREYLNVGTAAIAQLNLLGDLPAAPREAHVRVSLANTSCDYKSPFSEGFVSNIIL